MKTFKEFQEDYTSALNPVKPVTDLIGAGLGAYELGRKAFSGLSNIFQARKANKARKPYEKRDTTKTSKSSKEEMLNRVREAQKRIENEVKNKEEILNTPTDLDKFSGKKVSPEIKRKINKPENQFNSYNPIEEEAPTNNVGGGQIAGTVEAGDDPPVKKKKRYIYGGRGSRKMWMNNK